MPCLVAKQNKLGRKLEFVKKYPKMNVLLIWPSFGYGTTNYTTKSYY